MEWKILWIHSKKQAMLILNIHTTYKRTFSTGAKSMRHVDSLSDYVPRNKKDISSGVKLSIAASSALIVPLIMLAFFS
jgi:hypothetical protein